MLIKTVSVQRSHDKGFVFDDWCMIRKLEVVASFTQTVVQEEGADVAGADCCRGLC